MLATDPHSFEVLAAATRAAATFQAPLTPPGDRPEIRGLDVEASVRHYLAAGIAPEKLPEIFKPFVSSKGAKGTGLGLAMSRKILREHGGDIVVQSQPGKGSRFVLRLPVKSPLAVDFGQTNPDMPAVRPPEDE